MENQTTQFKFRASSEFVANLDMFWRHLRNSYPEKYGDVNNKGQFVIACILNDINSTKKGQKLLNLQGDNIPEMEWWQNQQETFEDALESVRKTTKDYLDKRVSKK